jgi:hypothetical protein
MKKTLSFILVIILAATYTSTAFAVNSAETPYYFNHIRLRNASNVDVNKLINGGNIQRVTIVRNDGVTAVLLKLVAAQYEDGELVKIDTYSSSSTSTMFNITMNHALTDITEDTVVKLFLWNTYDNVMPMAVQLTAYAEYNADITVAAGEEYSFPVYRNGSSTNFRFKFNPEYFSVVSSTAALPRQEKMFSARYRAIVLHTHTAAHRSRLRLSPA